MADQATKADEARAWVGTQLDDVAGAAVGKVDGVLHDPDTGAAEWLAVKAGRFGARVLVPARDAVAGVESVWVPFSAEAIKAAPKAPAGGLTQAEELALLAHYGLAAAVGRAGELGNKEPTAQTALPA
jgi:PRC-barrel domain protein